MIVPKVFIASSSEGLDVVNRVQELLQEDLSGVAEVSPWPKEFQLTKAYIESLERSLNTSDFAVLVLTPDDYTKSRKAETFSPRDNVVFELGLFFGRLGRDRCFLLQRVDHELKLPSDLLGIEPAKFSKLGEPTLKDACSRIGDAIHFAIKTLPSRPKLDDEKLALQAAFRKFSDRITGWWWERIQLSGEKLALSFFTIDLDDVFSSVQLEGKAYGPDGVQVANWRSAAARMKDNKILYVRECQRLDISNPEWLPGLGEINFDKSSDDIMRGFGKFWESDESHINKTVIKRVDLRRNQDEKYNSKMQTGSDEEKKSIVLNMLRTW